MKNRFRYFAVGCFLFFLFILFSYLVHKDIFSQLDFDTTVKLQDAISGKFNNVFSLLSDLGIFEVMLGVLIIILVFLRKIKGIFVFGFFALFHLIEIFGKFFVNHLPPPEFLLKTEKIINFPQYHVRLENSYPSGHAGRAAFMSLFLGLIIWRSKKISKTQKYLIIGFLVGYDLVMFVSRIYLGEHWTTDVFGGALLGFTLAILSFAII